MFLSVAFDRRLLHQDLFSEMLRGRALSASSLIHVASCHRLIVWLMLVVCSKRWSTFDCNEMYHRAHVCRDCSRKIITLFLCVNLSLRLSFPSTCRSGQLIMCWMHLFLSLNIVCLNVQLISRHTFSTSSIQTHVRLWFRTRWNTYVKAWRRVLCYSYQCYVWGTCIVVFIPSESMVWTSTDHVKGLP